MLRRAALVGLVLLAGAPVLAWAPETRVRMVDEAVRLMPASLRLALETHRREVLSGMLDPLAEEDVPAHAASWHGGALERSIELEARELRAALGRPTDFDEIARRFGRLAHFVADAGFPPGVSDRDGSTRYAHFAQFCERRRERFPLVFLGHAHPDLDAGDLASWATDVVSRANGDDRSLARAYAAAGRPPDPSHFGDRSVPFAVGSLAWSNTINDVVRIWLALWREAGGDLSRTPYRKAAAR